MARVTVEDCVEKIPNRFDLVLLAAHRTRNISAGASLTLDRDKDKNPVVALRELASENLDLTDLRESLISNLQRVILNESIEAEEENTDVLALEHNASTPTEMSEIDLMRALESDRENSSENRF